MKTNLILFVIMLIQINVFSQNINKDIRQGVKLYEDSSYVEAEQKFRNALQKDQDSFVSSFNLADAIYKQENYEKSESLFRALTEKAETKEEKSMSYHNFGNSLFKQEKIKESVEAYKNALRNNPSDIDSKFNLSLAQKLLKKQEENKEDKKEDDKKEEEKEEEEEEKKEEEESESDESQENKEPQDQQKPETPQDPNEMTEEEAQQMLDALEQQEKELQEDLQKKKRKAVNLKIEKDW
jgi:Ca-activated chloride channel family protein